MYWKKSSVKRRNPDFSRYLNPVGYVRHFDYIYLTLINLSTIVNILCQGEDFKKISVPGNVRQFKRSTSRRSRSLKRRSAAGRYCRVINVFEKPKSANCIKFGEIYCSKTCLRRIFPAWVTNVTFRKFLHTRFARYFYATVWSCIRIKNAADMSTVNPVYSGHKNLRV